MSKKPALPRFARMSMMLTMTASAVLPLVAGAAELAQASEGLKVANISGIAPTSARLDVALTTFTVTGTGLKASAVSVQDCVNPAVVKDTRTQVVFTCTPVLPGKKAVYLSGVASGVTVRIDHPTRLGNPAARGVPSTNGVSAFNGNYFLEVVDMQVPGKGLGFTLSRSYNSYYFAAEKARGSVDNYHPWRSNWDLKIAYTDDQRKQRVYVQRPDGSGANFFLDTVSGQWVAMDQGSFDLLKFDAPSAGKVSLYTRSGVVYVFNAPSPGTPGLLQSVGDLNGNQAKVSYGANGQITTVKDASGRTYNFTYDPNGNISDVEDQASPVHHKVHYSWIHDQAPGTTNNRDRIGTVTDLRGKVTTYQYTEYTDAKAGNQVLLTKVLDPLNNPVVQLSYAPKVYGNWGAVSVADGVNNTWKFNYCAVQPDGNTCGAPDTSVGFKTTLTPPLGAARYANFDNAGRVTSTLDGRGNASTLTQPPDADLLANQYRLASLVQAQQSARGKEEGYQTGYSYAPDNTGNLVQTQDNKGQLHNQTWTDDPNQTNRYRVASRTSPLNLQHSFAYDPAGNPTTHTLPGNGGAAFTQLTYNAPVAGAPDTFTDALKNSSKFGYDKNTGDLLTVTDPYNNTVQRKYDAWGRVLQLIGPAVNGVKAITTTTYDEAGHVLTVTDPMGGLTTNTYDAAGNLQTRLDPLNTLTTYYYDAANRLTSTVTTITGQTITTRYVYDELGRVKRVINPNSNTRDTTYDDAGNVHTRQVALLNVTAYEYDADNRVTKVTDPAGRITRTGYDEMGRVINVTTTADGVDLTQTYEYDADGRVARYIDARGNSTYYAYDPDTGYLKTVTDAAGVPSSADYDLAGNVIAIHDPKGNITRFEYDALNRRTKTIDANNRVWTTAYDEAGRVKTRTAPGAGGAQLVTTYTYDLANRLKQVDLPVGGSLKYSYDANGNRTSVTDATGTTTYLYDGVNRLTQVTQPSGAVLKYAYDAGGNRTKITYPNNKLVRYHFDAADRLDQVTDWLSKTTAYTLNDANQVTQVAYGNGSTTTMGYDTASRLRSLVNAKATGEVISSHQMDLLDGNGNPIQITTTLPLLPSFTSSTTDMTYDPANRLATYNGTAVTHDDAGRITALNGNTYAYDGRDLMTDATVAGKAYHYTYNGAGQRVAKTADGVTTNYVIDPNASLPNVVAETDAAGATLRSYIHGYGLIEQIDAAGAAHFYHFDPTGHTLALTDATSAVTDTYAYTPYGDTNSTGSTVNPFRYVGKYGVMDEGNGLHYMRARYYRADIARFLGLDHVEGSIKIPQSINPYSYSSGRVMVESDPSGLCDSTKACCTNVDVTSGNAGGEKSEGKSFGDQVKDELGKPTGGLSAAVGLLADQMTTAYKAAGLSAPEFVETAANGVNLTAYIVEVGYAGVTNFKAVDGDMKFNQVVIPKTIGTLTTLGASSGVMYGCATAAAALAVPSGGTSVVVGIIGCPVGSFLVGLYAGDLAESAVKDNFTQEINEFTKTMSQKDPQELMIPGYDVYKKVKSAIDIVKSLTVHW